MHKADGDVALRLQLIYRLTQQDQLNIASFTGIFRLLVQYISQKTIFFTGHNN